jgi:hypothetical protein
VLTESHGGMHGAAGPLNQLFPEGARSAPELRVVSVFPVFSVVNAATVFSASSVISEFRHARRR